MRYCCLFVTHINISGISNLTDDSDIQETNKVHTHFMRAIGERIAYLSVAFLRHYFMQNVCRLMLIARSCTVVSCETQLMSIIVRG